MFKSLGNAWDRFINTDEYSDKGKTGERLLFLELKRYVAANKKQIIRNVYLKKKDGKYTEIDVVYITMKGVFVFESKNYSGWIGGNEKDKNWTQVLNKNSKFKIYNPIWQNNTHIEALKENLSDFKGLRFYSIIAFKDDCNIQNITKTSDHVYITKISNVPKLLNGIFKNLDRENAVITLAQRDEIINRLAQTSRPDDKIVQQHLEDIKDTMENNVCPRCNSELIERTNKTNGNAFFGCSTFPNVSLQKQQNNPTPTTKRHFTKAHIYRLLPSNIYAAIHTTIPHQHPLLSIFYSLLSIFYLLSPNPIAKRHFCKKLIGIGKNTPQAVSSMQMTQPAGGITAAFGCC